MCDNKQGCVDEIGRLTNTVQRLRDDNERLSYRNHTFSDEIAELRGALLQAKADADRYAAGLMAEQTARAELEQPKPAPVAVPDGWVLLPDALTSEQCQAIEVMQSDNDGLSFDGLWTAITENAPKPPINAAPPAPAVPDGWVGTHQKGRPVLFINNADADEHHMKMMADNGWTFRPVCYTSGQPTAALPGGLHPAVVAFAKAMQHKLDVNRHKDGAGWDRDPEGRRSGWAGCSVNFLLSKLDEEAGELSGEFGTERDIKAIRNEAADVGNIAMMLADIAGALDYEDAPAPAVDEQDSAIKDLVDCLWYAMQCWEYDGVSDEHGSVASRCSDLLNKFKDVRNKPKCSQCGDFGGNCDACGNRAQQQGAIMALTKNQRAELREMFGGRCAYCGCELPEKGWHADHIQPVRRETIVVRDNGFFKGFKSGAPYHEDRERLDNYFPACAPCNLFKATFSVDRFRIEISQQIERARRASVNFRTAERFGMLQVIDRPVVFYFEQQEIATHED